MFVGCGGSRRLVDRDGASVSAPRSAEERVRANMSGLSEAWQERVAALLAELERLRGFERWIVQLSDALKIPSDMGMVEAARRLRAELERLRETHREVFEIVAPGEVLADIADRVRRLRAERDEAKRKLADRVDRHDIDGKALVRTTAALSHAHRALTQIADMGCDAVDEAARPCGLCRSCVAAEIKEAP